MSSFNDFQLSESILKALDQMGFQQPSPIQSKAIPLIQQGNDVIALAQTGSGKTATCAIPVCQRVDISRPEIQALIIVPTRELALQYATETQKIGKVKKVKAFAMYGGEDSGIQESKLSSGVQVLIATPGRLIDFIYSRRIDLSHVETIILDEADEMLSMGFYEDLEFIFQCLNHEHQTLLFSATMPKEIKSLAVHHMKEPLEVSLIAEEASPKLIDHYFLYCRHDQRVTSLVQQITESNPKQSIIFCHSRIEVEKVCGELRKQIKGVEYMHAGLNQNVRTSITDKFRRGKIRYLVATDVAARGLDFSGVTHVFIYHLSDDPDLYVHRSGRTGRYDRKGTVITLVTSREMRTFHKILERLKIQPQWIGKPPSAKEPPRKKHNKRPYRKKK